MGGVRFRSIPSFLLALGFTLILMSGSACRNPFSPIEDIDRIPEVLVVNGTKISMQVYLYRDFMPGGEPGGSPLFVIVFLIAEGSNHFPDQIGADRVWVTNRTDTWTTRFTHEERLFSPAEPNKISLSAGGGPKWEVGTRADVVVRVTVAGKGELYLKSLNHTVVAVW
ncbi:MAG TPA: hypothetical protein DCR87_02355 [Acidobacteria bacterium]|nr:hypothetical protein [Acidobacteriota bacterium]